MSLSPSIKKSVEKKLDAYCQRRVPEILHDQVKLFYTIRGNNVTLIETRPYYADPTIWTKLNIAQMRYDANTEYWTLYCPDRNGKWHRYIDLNPSNDLKHILNKIDDDPTHIFWG
jgi:hypothetical protein